MIVTLTPNPSVDRTVRLPALRRGAVNRARQVTVEPSGKGVNVSRALADSGHATTAVLPLGGPEGEHLGALLRRAGVRFVSVPISAAIRSNVTLLEPDGVATKVNEPGPRLSAAETDALLAAADHAAIETPDVAAAAGVGWTVCCGSLPPGVAADFYARVVAQAHRPGGQVAVDAGGEPLRQAAAAGADLLAPNREELAEATGLPVRTVGDVVAAATRLRQLGARAVLASLGSDGAVLVGPHQHGSGPRTRSGDPQTWHGEALPVEVVSTVGAGDALLAGFLAAGAAGPAALRAGLAWAAACCRLPDSKLPSTMPGALADAGREVVIHDGVDPVRPLSSTSTGRT